MSTIQFGGRINRNCEASSAYIWEFSLDEELLKTSSEFSANPGLDLAISAREDMSVSPSNCTVVIEKELGLQKTPCLIAKETLQQFVYVNNDFQVIPDLTESIVISKELMAKIKAGEAVSPVEINRNSVSLYRSKFEKETSPFNSFVEHYEDMYFWTGQYNPNTYGILG